MPGCMQAQRIVKAMPRTTCWVFPFQPTLGSLGGFTSLVISATAYCDTAEGGRRHHLAPHDQPFLTDALLVNTHANT